MLSDIKQVDSSSDDARRVLAHVLDQVVVRYNAQPLVSRWIDRGEVVAELSQVAQVHQQIDVQSCLNDRRLLSAERIDPLHQRVIFGAYARSWSPAMVVLRA